VVVRPSFVTAIVSPRALSRECLRHILGAADFSIAAMAATVGEIVPYLEAEERPILFVLDVDAEQDHAAQIVFLRERYPNAHIAMLADHDQLGEASVLAAFRSGADAYFQRPSADIFVKSLELVVKGETILPPSILSFILGQRKNEEVTNDLVARYAQQRSPPDAEAPGSQSPRLSAREQCILRCLIEGHSNKMIARKNDLAEATVKVHVKAILRKIRVNNRTQAAVWGMNHDALLLGMANGEREGTQPRAVDALANYADPGLGQSGPVVHGAPHVVSADHRPEPRLSLG
jgi:two-component system nitrate/nitrite response regulator NarL